MLKDNCNETSLINPTPYTACRDFLIKYSRPALPKEAIFQGFQNRASLPAKSSEYAVMAINQTTKCGSSIESIIPAEDDQSADISLLKSLLQCAVQIDFHSSSDLGRKRAESIYNVFASDISHSFFKDYRLNYLHAEPIKLVEAKDESNQFVRIYSIILHLAYWHTAEYETSCFKYAHARIENVDAHHKP